MVLPFRPSQGLLPQTHTHRPTHPADPYTPLFNPFQKNTFRNVKNITILRSPQRKEVKKHRPANTPVRLCACVLSGQYESTKSTATTTKKQNKKAVKYFQRGITRKTCPNNNPLFLIHLGKLVRKLVSIELHTFRQIR